MVQTWRRCLAHCLVLAAALISAATSEARADKRVALVIGNSAYQNVAKLPNPGRDAAAIADLLKNAGFDVVDGRRDLGNLELKRALRDFSFAARDADIAVVFFAGHGIEVGGSNYLIPVDARLATDFDVEDEAIALDRIVKALEPVKRLRLIILDACRDNPFAGAMRRTMATRTVIRGLAKVEPTSPNTMIAFAAREGSTAEDGNGEHSPFAAALIKHLAVPDLDVRIAFGKIRDEVLKATGNRQEPFVYGSLGGDAVSLVQGAVAPVARSADPAYNYELAAKVGTKEAWNSFLVVVPMGFYADLARAQLEKLNLTAKEQERQRAATEEAARLKAQQEEKLRVEDQQKKLEREQADRDRIQRETEQARRDQIQREEQGKADRAKAEQLKAEQAKAAADRLQAVHETADKAPAPVAALVPPAEPNSPSQPPTLTGGELAREIKKELSRLGCYSGRIDEKWGDPETKASVEKFIKLANLHSSFQLEMELLNAARQKSGRLCPLECDIREREVDGRCIAKTCAPGQILGANGKCAPTNDRTANRPPENQRKLQKRVEPAARSEKQPQADAAGKDTNSRRQEITCGPGGCVPVPKNCRVEKYMTGGNGPKEIADRVICP